MIGFLRGIVISLSLLPNIDALRVVLEVNNIGYILFTPTNSTMRQIRVGDEFEAWISHIVREDSEALYAFDDDEHRALFDQLITVSGIGPRIGLSMLAKLGADGIRTAISSDDVKMLATTPGLGNKGAAKIILDLKGKLVQEKHQTSEGAENSTDDAYETLVAAIVSLGFKAQNAVDAADATKKELGEITAQNLSTALKMALTKI
jgi:Holliday junction DNA helicase RuvA